MTIDSCTRCGTRLRCTYVNATPPILCRECVDAGLTQEEDAAVLGKLFRKMGVGGKG